MVWLFVGRKVVSTVVVITSSQPPSLPDHTPTWFSVTMSHYRSEYLSWVFINARWIPASGLGTEWFSVLPEKYHTGILYLPKILYVFLYRGQSPGHRSVNSSKVKLEAINWILCCNSVIFVTWFQQSKHYGDCRCMGRVRYGTEKIAPNFRIIVWQKIPYIIS